MSDREQIVRTISERWNRNHGDPAMDHIWRLRPRLG